MKFFKFLLFLVIFLSFSICNLAFIISLSIAASAVPAPGVIPCDQTRDPEFDPTRPYQASPCGDSPKAFFCSNSVVLTIGSVSTPYEGPGWQSCKGRCSGGPIDITVDLSNAQLPVLGNSQDKNIDSATKMNEYVNAYLGEPTKKLLPQTIQEAQRIAIIETTKTETTSEADDAGKTQKEPANHNQIVVCYDKPIAILPWFTNLFGIEAKGLGKAVPKDCHDDKHEYTLRLQNWDNTKFDVLYQAIQKWILDHHFYPADFISQIIASASIDRWPKKIPPLPWEFTDPEKYTKAYNEWRGDLCAYINVPILGKKLVCIGIPGVTNSDYADLFPYIPLANTVDKIAGQTVNSVEIKSDGANFKSKGYTEVIAPKLYFAHTQEDFDLSSLLQKTFKAEGVAEALPQPLPKDVQQNSTCQILKSYTNPGDDLTFDEPKKSLKVTGIYYEVSEIKCPDDVDRKKKCTDPNDPKTCKDIAPDCSADVTVTIPMDNKSPYLNEIWDTTVAGNQSIFRRIYPKTGPEAPISCIADIPGVSKVTYASDKQNIDKVTEPDGSSVGGGSKSVDAQFYFPHLGSISDYFLKGIQTALRPKGYGEALPAGLCSNNLACGDLTNLPKAKESSCNLGSVSPRIEDIPQSLKQIVSLAADTYKVPPNLILGVMYGEGAFNRD
ncbi:MAG TPA: hypothetical protein VL401_00005, partial [Alphaproteobacteria bacterium]|nr:hypothetical protein [Alphaproteobacteria bacterium]